MNLSVADLYDRSYGFGRTVEAKGGFPLRILLSIDQELAADPTAQLIALAICNQLPRVTERYTNVDLKIRTNQPVTMPRVPAGFLGSYLMDTLRNACLAGEFRIVDRVRREYDYGIIIGKERELTARHLIYAWSSGWRCFVSMARPLIQPRSLGVLNPFAALGTASLAVMMLYHSAEDLRELFHSHEINGWSIFDYTVTSEDGPCLPESIEVGRVVQAGLGGTGTALLWVLRHGPELSGEWQGYEHEMLEISNANRYPLMGARETGSKASLAQERFASIHPALNFRVTPRRVEDVHGGLLDSTLALATVDDPQIRVALQRRGANVILNVGTNSQWLSMSRHELSSIRNGGACVECFYGSDEQAPRRFRESTVSFVIGLVAAALGGEFVKSYCFPQHVLRNSWLANVFAPAGARALLRPPMPNCETCSSIRI